MKVDSGHTSSITEAVSDNSYRGNILAQRDTIRPAEIDHAVIPSSSEGWYVVICNTVMWFSSFVSCESHQAESRSHWIYLLRPEMKLTHLLRIPSKLWKFSLKWIKNKPFDFSIWLIKYKMNLCVSTKMKCIIYHVDIYIYNIVFTGCEMSVGKYPNILRLISCKMQMTLDWKEVCQSLNMSPSFLSFLLQISAITFDLLPR